MNADEIGHGYAEKTKSKNKETLTWRFYAPNVHDFAWAADPEYTHDIVTSDTGVDLHFFYKPTVNIDDWKKLQDDSLKLLEYFELNIGPYPWKQYSIIQGGDGGMEYAMCTMITGGKTLSEPAWRYSPRNVSCLAPACVGNKRGQTPLDG